MGFFKEFKKRRKEDRAFKKIVAKKTTQIARKAYAEEAERVAKEKAIAKARRPSTISTIGKLAAKGAKRVVTPKARPFKKRKIKYAPMKRKRVKKIRTPSTLNEAMYGY